MILQIVSNKERAKEIFDSIPDPDWDIDSLDVDSFILTFWAKHGVVLYQYFSESLFDINYIIESAITEDGIDAYRQE